MLHTIVAYDLVVEQLYVDGLFFRLLTFDLRGGLKVIDLVLGVDHADTFKKFLWINRLL